MLARYRVCQMLNRPGPSTRASGRHGQRWLWLSPSGAKRCLSLAESSSRTGRTFQCLRMKRCLSLAVVLAHAIWRTASQRRAMSACKSLMERNSVRQCRPSVRASLSPTDRSVPLATDRPTGPSRSSSRGLIRSLLEHSSRARSSAGSCGKLASSLHEEKFLTDSRSRSTARSCSSCSKDAPVMEWPAVGEMLRSDIIGTP